MTGCRVAQVLMQYCVGANYYWLLVEGLYLHSLLVMAVFSDSRYFYGYLIIGWGTHTHTRTQIVTHNTAEMQMKLNKTGNGFAINYPSHYYK